MRTVGVTCVKNEADIIEAFVRHNLHYLDALLILDHGSTDQTSHILFQLTQEGLPLSVIWDPSLGKFQGEKMTLLMQQAAREHEADWVILLDADEFIKCASDHLPLPDLQDEMTYWKVGVHNYGVSDQDNPAVLNPVERIGSRLAQEPTDNKSLEEQRYHLKSFVPKKLALQEGAYVAQGNHYLLVAHTEPPHELWKGFVLAHYSIRFAGQYASKISIGLLQQLYKSSPQGGMDSFYFSHFEELKNDFDQFARRLSTRKPSYVESLPGFDPSSVTDPLNYQGGPLRYTPPISDFSTFATNILNYTEILARSLAEHAASHQTKTQISPQAGQLFCAYLIPAGTPQKKSQTFLLDVTQMQTLRFVLDDRGTNPIIRLGWQSPGALIEIVCLHIRQPGHDEWTEWTGPLLRSQCWIDQGAAYAHHEHYFSFFKGEEPAVIALKLPAGSNPQTSTEMEVRFWVEMNPARIGSRLFHNRNFDLLLGNVSRIHQLEQKLGERSSFRGAIKYQIYLLRRFFLR